MAAHIGKFRERIEEFLNKYPAVDDVVGKASAATKVSKVNLIMGVIGFTAVWLAIGYGAPFLCDFIGFVFPAYLSFKAVESADTRDDTQWLTYWIVYSYFGILEFFSDYLLFWIPFYSLIKCSFLLWMVNYDGASLIYTRFIRGMMRDNCEIIDVTLQAATDLQTNVQTYVTDKLSSSPPPPSLAGGLRQGLTLGMLATQTNVDADDEGSVLSSPGEVTPADFGLDSRDVVMVTSQEENEVEADDFSFVSPTGVSLISPDVTVVTPDVTMVTPDVTMVTPDDTMVTHDVTMVTHDVSGETPDDTMATSADNHTEDGTNGASVELLNFVPEEFPQATQA